MSVSEQRIRDMVRSALEENPAITNRVLLDRARQIDADAVDGLSLRQFHAKFRLPVARILSAGSSPTKPRKRAARPRRRQEEQSSAAKRAAVRDAFRRFAVQLAHAESRSEIVRAVARIDEFVEDVFRTLAGPDGTTGRDASRPPREVVRSSPSRSEQREEPARKADLPATPAQGPTPANAQAGEPRAREMARRRRPKGLKSPAAADAALRAEHASDEAGAAPVQPDPPPEEPPAPPERSGFSLSDDLEEFRRRRADRERTRLRQ